MRAKFLPFATAALLLSALAPAAHAKPAKACDMLSHQAAEAVYGSTLAKTFEVPGMLCNYNNNNDTSLVQISFQIFPDGVQPNFGSTVLKSTLHKDYGTDVVTNIPGLGEENYCITSKEISKETIAVVYHKALITLIVTGSKNPNRHAAMLQTIKQALTQF